MRVQIDLNRRAKDGTTVADLADITPLQQEKLVAGRTVTVFEPEDAIRGRATVVRVSADSGLVYLDVDWSSLEDDDWSSLEDDDTCLFRGNWPLSDHSWNVIFTCEAQTPVFTAPTKASHWQLHWSALQTDGAENSTSPYTTPEFA